jgi:hypothetical protein
VWTLTAGGGFGGMLGLGIGPGWVVNGYERQADGSGVLLWANASTGQAMAWTLTSGGSFVDMKGFGVSAGWEATSYLRNE